MITWPLIKNSISFLDRLQLCKFIMSSDRYTNGAKVREFETAWAKWVGSKHALMVSSGSTANFLLLAAIKEKYGLSNGDKVLVPACTWVTNISPVTQLGLTPIFCDVNLTNFSFDIDHMKKIHQLHPDIKVIFVTHLLGFSAENEKYQEIFPNAIVIDDICESHGCTNEQGTRRGATSIGATFSFYFGHHMTTIEGGMINTNDSELYDLMRIKRSHGLARESASSAKYNAQYPDIHPQFLFVTDGYNFRSTEINAVIGLQQLPRLDNNIKIRRNNFAEFSKITYMFNDLLEIIPYQEGNSNYAFPLICKDANTRIKLITAFNKLGIEHRPIVSGNLLRQPFLKGYTFATPKISYNADILHDCGVYIGNSQFVSSHDIEQLRQILKNLT
jgi:CDP-6-deoxy-D-xylo-4-hexulose-3-dehydrase